MVFTKYYSITRSKDLVNEIDKHRRTPSTWMSLIAIYLLIVSSGLLLFYFTTWIVHYCNRMFYVVVMEEELNELLFWYKCARFCSACRYVQENYNVCSCFPSPSDLTHDLHQIIMIGDDRGCFAKHTQSQRSLVSFTWLYSCFYGSTRYMRTLHFTYTVHLNWYIHFKIEMDGLVNYRLLYWQITTPLLLIVLQNIEIYVMYWVNYRKIF